MLRTGPDIAFTQFFKYFKSTYHQPLCTKVSARRILRYLKGSMDLGIEYNGKEGLVLKVFVDAYWGTSQNRRSIRGYVVILLEAQYHGVAKSKAGSHHHLLKQSIWLSYKC
jgi:hypothetical protein